jgi:uncharacterized membrane protein
MNLAIWLAFGAMIGWGVADFLLQRTVQKIGWLETIWWVNISCFLFLLPLIGPSLAALNGQSILLLVVLGLVAILGATTHFKALETGKLSVVEIILFFELPLTIVLGMTFLKNSLSLYQTLLIFLLFIGVILISLDINKIQQHHFWFFWQRTKFFVEKGVWLAAITAVLLALTNFFTAVGAVNVSPILILWFPSALGAAVCLVYFIYRNKLKRVIKDSRPHWVLILATVIIDLLGWLFFSFSMAEKGELAIIATITEGYIVVAMLLGLKFNREKIRGWQYVGVALTVLASLVIGLTS